MNKIEELIQQYCPNGVEFKELGECLFKNIGGGTPSKAKPEYWNGDIPWASVKDVVKCGTEITETQDFITYEGLKNSPSNIVPKGEVIMITRINPGLAVVAGKDIAINQDLRGLFLKDFLDQKYLVYYFQILKIEGNGTTVKGISISELEKLQIPIPPLPIQQEIVSILDKFTQLEAELEAELEARGAQYKYYRDQLLRFERKDVEWLTLGEIGEFIRGKRFVKTDMVSEGVPCIHYGEMYTHYNIWANQSKSFVEPELVKQKNLRVAKKGDVVIVSAGETIEDIGNGVAWLSDKEVVIHDACFALIHNQNPKFISYYLQTNLFRSQIKRYISSGKISSINAKGLSKAKMPVPPIEEQNRIVEILDKFDALVNDISVGIPAEIAARRKQYEYYRSKLLSFESVFSE